jgi:hypothetical protein
MIPNQRIPINPINPAEPFAHFVQAQSMVYDAVIQELGQGRKETHWMWYIFPQLKGLGTSLKAQKYGIDNLRLVLTHRDKHPSQIFSEVDTLKFRSCMTLFKFVGYFKPKPTTTPYPKATPINSIKPSFGVKTGVFGRNTAATEKDIDGDDRHSKNGITFLKK